MATKKVLIVDDDPGVRTFMTLALRRLKQFDVEFLTAENGEFALKMVEYDQPDLVFLDLMMPGMDGFEVCRRIKGNEQTKNTYVIILTARNHAEDKQKGHLAGADEYIVKPSTPAYLLERAQHALGVS